MNFLGLLGNKVGMTQIYNQKGEKIPVTIIKAGPCFITQIKLSQKNNYNIIQLGYLEINYSSKKLTKSNLGHFLTKQLFAYRHLKEYILRDKIFLNYKIGDEINTNYFKIGQKIKITGLTIGKGNAGNIKQHHFTRGPMTHGSKHHRLQGSIGSGTTPGRVIPGKKMPGRLGSQKQTISNLEILDIDYFKNLLVVKGSVPGKTGNLLNIYSS
jgi:large subunit ribosomal protein L3